MRYAIYARRSTREKDERQVQSIEDQLNLARQHAHRLGVSVELEITESVSAKEPYKQSTSSGINRPARDGFTRLIHLIEIGEITGIIAWHPDRLSRNEIDAAILTHLIRTHHLQDLQFCNYTFNNSPEGVMMLQMALSQSQYYSSKLGVDVTRGLNSKVSKGWAPRFAPPGYLNDKHKEKGNKTISLDPQRFETIRKVWDMALSGNYNTIEILNILNNQWQYRSRPTRTRGEKPMSKSTLYRLLSNVFYTGNFWHNGTLCPGSHPPMITMEEFHKVQRLHLRKVNPNVTVTKSHSLEFAFTGLIRCHSCNGQVTAQRTQKRKGRTYIYYHCQSRRGKCGWKNINEAYLEEQIVTWLKDVTVLPEFIEWAWHAHEEWMRRYQTSQVESQQRRKKLNMNLETQIDNLLTLKLRDLITDEEYKIKKVKLLEEKAAVSEGMGEELGDIQTRVESVMKNVTSFMSKAVDAFIEGDITTKRTCLRAIGSNYQIKHGILVWEPHPLLLPIKDSYRGMEDKWAEIKPQNIRFGDTKKEPLRTLFPTWSRIWEENQVLIAEERITFPKIADIRGLGKE
jgi:DNA invertase Pin-like site-specific DNA recombinase